MNTHRGKLPVPLQLVLIVPFVLQIFGAVSLVGYLSYRNGQKAVNDLASQLMDRTSDTVNQHLDSYLSIPHTVNQINADAIKMGLLDVRDRKTVSKYFWRLLHAYDLTCIALQLPTGEGAAAARYDGKTITVDDTQTKSPSLPKNSKTYLTDNEGNPTKVISTIEWDTLNEPLYAEPVKAGKPTWRIYTFYDPTITPYIAASAGRPVYDTNNKLLGVVGAEIHLLKLSEYLRKLKISRSGQVFIIERNGILVANSAKDQPFTIANNEIKRVEATNSSNSLVQGIAKHLQNQFNNFQSIGEVKNLHFKLEGKPYYIQVNPWRDKYGLDWLVVVSVPEREFMAQIHANTRITIFLCIGALLLATLMGIFTSHLLARSISRLTHASEAIAAGNLEQKIEDTAIQEFNTLAKSFNHMALQLDDSFRALEKSNEELEKRVRERTCDLENTLNQLQRTQAQMIQSEKMSSLGQLVAGVAHEINNPVSFIHGNLTHIEEYSHNLLNFIELYWRHYPNPVPQIQAQAEEIDLEFIQSDLPKTLASMKMGTERIREIVLSLRNFSRHDEAQLKSVNIHEGIDSTLLILQHRLKSRPERPEINIVKQYTDLPLVECYAGQLNQVFMNILTNAIDAIEQKNTKQTLEEIKENSNCITISTIVISDISEKWVQIAIADNGIGIPENVKQRIFDPFFTTKPVGKGTGMGMSISYQIIEKHGGKIEFSSTPGQGTEFIIQIPYF